MDRRVLILAPIDGDAAVVEQMLTAGGMAATNCTDERHLMIEMGRGAGAAVVAAECLGGTTTAALRRWLEAQPSWSDFPFIVLAPGHGAPAGGDLHDVAVALGNAVVIERPINGETLSSAAAAALRARERQYQARRHWIERENDERRLRVALLAGNLAAWTIAIAGRSLSASDAVKAHFGRSLDRPMSFADMESAIHPDDQMRFRTAFDEALGVQSDLDIECRIVWPQGAIRWLHFSGRTIYGDDGRPAMLSGVSLDVTARHQSEQEMQQRVEQAVARSQQAHAAMVQAQKMEAVGQLTGGIAHDFNNLLTAIVGNIDLISRRASDDRIRRMADRARQAAERAARLTGQLLAFSRSQRLDLRPVEIDHLLRDMRHLVARTIGPAISVRAQLTLGHRRATADGNQLELAMLNLAINARDAMPDGGALTIATRAEPGDDQSWLVIAVSDTGEGIAPDVLPRVFDPFFTTKPVGKGTGLGLSQVHGIANQSGGSVKIRSAPDEGTTVEIWLQEAKAAMEPATDAHRAGLYVGHGRVLVIDDDEDVRRFAVECLETLGFTVTQAEHGRAGLDRLEQDRPDLLIVDFAMPGMNGADVAAAARQHRADLPIILATGYADTRKVEAAFAQDSILRKPFRLIDLSHAVRHAMERA